MQRRDFLFRLPAMSAVVACAARSHRLLAASTELIRKPIPSSNELLPVIGLGTARRFEAASTEAELAPLRATLQRFKTLGGTVIDTAPSYGRAEALVGQLLSDFEGRPGLFLSTKLGATGRDAGLAQLEHSFKELRSPKLDLISVHNLQDAANQLPLLRDFKQAGRIRYLGMTTSFDRQYAAFETFMQRETLDFIQVDYALDNRDAAERILPLARDRGIAVMVNLPFGRGRLFNAVQGKPLPSWAADFDCHSWAQFFLKYLVSHEAVTVAIPGMSKPEYVSDNLGAAMGRLPDASTRRRMEAFIDAL